MACCISKRGADSGLPSTLTSMAPSPSHLATRTPRREQMSRTSVRNDGETLTALSSPSASVKRGEPRQINEAEVAVDSHRTMLARRRRRSPGPMPYRAGRGRNGLMGTRRDPPLLGRGRRHLRRVPQHRPHHPPVLAAWTAALARLLPAAPAAVLDCGAGTGFLSLMAARLGHRVTALDLSPGCSASAAARPRRRGPRRRHGRGPGRPAPARGLRRRDGAPPALGAPRPPGRPRRLARAPRPGAAWCWSRACGAPPDPVERVRRRPARRILGARRAPEHHAPLPAELRRRLPLGDRHAPRRRSGSWPQTPDGAAPGWSGCGDVEWAERRRLARPSAWSGVPASRRRGRRLTAGSGVSPEQLGVQGGDHPAQALAPGDGGRARPGAWSTVRSRSPLSIVVGRGPKVTARPGELAQIAAPLLDADRLGRRPS